MPFKRQKKKKYRLNNKKEDKTKDILTIASNKLKYQENNKNAINVKLCENKVTKVTEQREKKIILQSDMQRETIIENCEVKNVYTECSIPKITITLCNKITYRQDDENCNYGENDSISCYCLDSSSEDDNESDYDEFGDFKQTCSADVTTDEEMEEENESNV